MKQRTQFVLAALTLLSLSLPTCEAVAQQKQRVSYKSPVENTKYTKQTILDVGDMSGHQVRIFEIHRTYPNSPPMINGLKLVEQWTRGTSDYTDNNGTAYTYGVYVMENGDKFFSRTTVLAQSVGSEKFTNATVGYITGGTGKLAGIEGIVRSTGSAEPKAGVNENQTDLEYWFSK